MDCKECGLPVTSYKGDDEQVEPDVCESCFLTLEVPEEFDLEEFV